MIIDNNMKIWMMKSLIKVKEKDVDLYLINKATMVEEKWNSKN